MSGRALLREPLRPATVLLLAVLWLAGTAWLRPLALPDEGRYVGVAWEMVRSGHWLVPTLDGLPYFHKPPLFYWITATALSAFGSYEWAARLAPMLGASAGAWALYRFTSRYRGESTARLVLLVLVTQPLVFFGAQYANLDMLVAGCIAVTILAATHAVLQAKQGRRSRRALILAFLFAGLGLLAKGLIGVVLPALVILTWVTVLRRPRLLLPLLWLPGFALFLAVAAPWFLAMQLRFPEFADYFFVVQHFKRFATGGFNNAHPFWFLPVALALLTLPWFAWLPLAGKRRYWNDPQHGPVRQLMWIWAVVLTVFFSLPESKLIGYILPVAFPLAFLIGDGASALMAASPRARRWWLVTTGVAATVCLVGVVLVAMDDEKSMRDLGRTMTRQVAPQDGVVFLNDYFFDLPFYAGLRAPVPVVDDWDDPRLTQRDTWRKELFDAQRFSPPPAPQMLVEPAALAQTLCAHRVTWVVIHIDNVSRHLELAPGEVVARDGKRLLWRMPGLSAGDCPGTPSASSPDKS